MHVEPQDHHRRSIRRPGYDYAAAGAYFVTLCAQNRSCLFGDVVGGTMHPNAAGELVRAEWDALPDRFGNIELDEFVLMPNHAHGIIILHPPTDPTPWLIQPDGAPFMPHATSPNGTAPESLGRVIQAFKSITTTGYIRGVNTHGWRRFSGHLWQRDYFDHVIRNDASLERIREYVRTNPARWADDAEHPSGGGRDDVRAWVRTLVADEAKSRHEARGEHKVRPYRGGQGARAAPEVGRTQGSPLPDPPASNAENGGPAHGRAGLAPVSHGGEGRTQGSPLPGARARPSKPQFRIGHGYDLHRLQPGGKLVLGGVVVSSDVSPVAHSDGDVVLHAVVDALLGAMAWGDIGEHFPNTDDRWRDAASDVFVTTIYDRVVAAGYRVGNVDVTILAERPKLKPFKRQIAKHVARLLHVAPEQVNVKAGTNEGCDAIGRGEAIAAHAVLLLTLSDATD